MPNARQMAPQWRDEKRPINLVTCRATLAERDRLRILVKKYGLAGPSHFFRSCLERFFEADDIGNLQLPIDLVRSRESAKTKPAPEPERPKRRKAKSVKTG
jgi:hypothetical protein